MTEPEYPTRYVAVAERWPDEAQARAALFAELSVPAGTDLGPYLGLWLLPVADSQPVHLWSAADPQWLLDSGWQRVEAAS